MPSNINKMPSEKCFEDAVYRIGYELQCQNISNSQFDNTKQVEALARYADSQRAITAYNRLRKLKEPNIVHLLWSNSENKTDCVVYMMCHMKTYKAGVDSYNCGIPPIGKTTRQKDVHQNKLDKLRIKYLTELLTSGINTKSITITERIKEFHTARNP
ncbi:OLC1v1024462C1 [Oldenlandia corymbosa var. corymbosa]|uniref:OLC1v1024462C1 n=1 Tax=Oldenlandia corymbosa var. corymbosa TaxID=529605 RepID=A0AAV1C5U9_OLDCO|nr:OLC1v1024462C1 [Oldenlandia corymbosa var. corymbosa]